MRKIELLIKPVSYLCNLNCSYCFYKKTKNIYPNPEKMKFETLEKLIISALEYSDGGNSIFIWQGGEPLIAGIEFYRKVIELQIKYGKKGQKITNTIQTNGLLIDEKWIELFKNYNIFLGVSLDGPEEIHNFYRKYSSGKGTFRDVIKRVNLLREKNIDFNILSTIGDETSKYPEKILDFFISNSFYFLQFIPAVDRKNEKMKSFSVKPEDYGNFLCKIFDIWWKYGCSFSIRFFDDILQTLLYINPGSCHFQKECGEYLLVEYNGDVYPCDFFVDRDFKLGNIFENEFEELFEKRKEKFAKIKAISPEKCKKCEWNFICNNGCLWFRWVKNGNFYDTDWLCEGYKKFFDYTMARFKVLSEEFIKKLITKEAG